MGVYCRRRDGKSKRCCVLTEPRRLPVPAAVRKARYSVAVLVDGGTLFPAAGLEILAETTEHHPRSGSQGITAPRGSLLPGGVCKARTWLFSKTVQEPQQLYWGDLLWFWNWKYLYATESNSSCAFASNVLLCSLEVRKHLILERVNPSGCNTCKWAWFVQGKWQVLILWGIRKNCPEKQKNRLNISVFQAFPSTGWKSATWSMLLCNSNCFISWASLTLVCSGS